MLFGAIVPLILNSLNVLAPKSPVDRVWRARGSFVSFDEPRVSQIAARASAFAQQIAH